MEGGFTIRRFKQFMVGALVLLMFALASTGWLGVYVYGLFITGFWAARRLRREVWARQMSPIPLVLLIVELMFALMILQVFLSVLDQILTPSEQIVFLKAWLVLGWATLLALAVNVWVSKRWSLRRERAVDFMSHITMLAASALIGEAGQSVLEGANFRHSRRLALSVVQACYWMLFGFIVWQQISLLLWHSDLALLSFQLWLLSVSVWFGRVLVITMVTLRSTSVPVWHQW